MPDVINSLCPDKVTVHDCIEHHCTREPSALCCSLRVDGHWLSYSRDEFQNYVNRYAAAFSALIPVRTVILFIKKLDIHLLAAYIGAMKAGHDEVGRRNE